MSEIIVIDTDNIPFELILIDNASVEPEVMEYYQTISYKNIENFPKYYRCFSY